MARCVLALVVLWALPLQAQLRVTGIERVVSAEERAWGGIRFSPDGTRLYLTPPDCRGIWERTIATGAVREITHDQGSGFSFALSDDGKLIAWRRTTFDETTRARRQELVTLNLETGATETAGSGRSAATPAFAGNQLIASVDDRDLSRPVAGAAPTLVLGIEQLKIAVMLEGGRRLLEPLGPGRYVWPVLSPDRTRLAAYELVQGLFVCRPDGSEPVILGPYRAPAWTRDSRWLICMDDRDDGHQYVGSRLVAVARDGGTPAELSGTESINAMYPACSPVEDLIACVSMTGELYVVRYAEGTR